MLQLDQMISRPSFTATSSGPSEIPGFTNQPQGHRGQEGGIPESPRPGGGGDPSMGNTAHSCLVSDGAEIDALLDGLLQRDRENGVVSSQGSTFQGPFDGPSAERLLQEDYMISTDAVLEKLQVSWVWLGMCQDQNS